MVRKANVNEIRGILKESSLTIQERINVSPVQLSLPVDDKGARIKVSVLPGQKERVPRMIEVVKDSVVLQLTIEVQEDYQVFELQS